MPRDTKSLFFICTIFSAVVFLLSAYFNFCYIHPDEYFQIVEFASYKLSITPPESLAWEYADKIRPAFQPFIAFEIFRALDFIGIRDHYTHLFSLRFSSMIFTLFSISIFCLANIRRLDQAYHKLYILATFLFWAPYFFGVRFSSEAWAGDCMLLGTSLLLCTDSIHKTATRNIIFLIIGLFLGAAFLFRFQTAFFSLGIGAWLLFIKREKIIPITLLIMGVMAILGVGMLMDRWLYGEWVCSPWLYFESNILKGVAGEFGTKPFYIYFTWFLTFLSPPIGFIFVCSLLLLFIRLPKNLYTWMLLPFLLAHILTGHKEIRFIFPLFLYLPIVCTLVYQYIREHGQYPFLYQNKAIRSTIKTLLIAGNFIFLSFFVFLSHSFSNDVKNLGPYIHEAAKRSAVHIIYDDAEAHPFILPHSRYKSNIYPMYLAEKNISNTRLLSWDSLATAVDTGGIRLISANKFDIEHAHGAKQLSGQYDIVASTIPIWVLNNPLANHLGQGINDDLDRNTYLLIKLKAKL